MNLLFRLFCLFWLSATLIAFSCTSHTAAGSNTQGGLSLPVMKELDFVPLNEDFKLEQATDRQGITWIKGVFPDSLLGKEVVFRLNTARIIYYDFFASRADTLYQIQKQYRTLSLDLLHRYPTYRLIVDSPEYYLRLQHNLPGILKPEIQENVWQTAMSSRDATHIMAMGLYYGIVALSVIFNVIFYLIFKDRRFILYCLLTLSHMVSFTYEDGLLYVLWSEENRFVYYSILWSTGITAICALLFTVYFLRLEHSLPRWKKYIGGAGLALILLPFIYIATGDSLWYHLQQSICFSLALLAFGIAVKQFRNDVYARFLVFSFSLVILSGFLYVLHSYIDPVKFSWFGLNLFRATSALETVAISFAIIFRIRSLQEENRRYRRELEQYLKQLNTAKNSPSVPDVNQASPTDSVMALIENHQLTEREVEVLECIWQGMSNQEIADKLCISLSTTKYHVGNIYTKLDVKNRMQAMTMRPPFNEKNGD